MAKIPELTDNLDIIAGLGDNPNTDNDLSSADLKAKFDKGPKIIRDFINNYVVPALNNYIVQTGFLPLTGGTMSGDIAMSGKKLTGLGTPEADGDAVTKGYADKLVPTVIPVTGGGTGANTAESARANLGAAAVQHAHTMQDIAGGVIPMTGGGTGAQNGADGLANLLAAGYMRLSGYQIVESVEAIPADAPEGALFVIPIGEA